MNHPASAYRGYRFPPYIIGHCVWLYFRFSLSYRDLEVMTAERGVIVTYESIRAWCENRWHSRGRMTSSARLALLRASIH